MIIDHLITREGFELFVLNDHPSHTAGCALSRGNVTAEFAWSNFGRDCLRRYSKDVARDSIHPAGITEEAFTKALGNLRMRFTEIISEE